MPWRSLGTAESQGNSLRASSGAPADGNCASGRRRTRTLLIRTGRVAQRKKSAFILSRPSDGQRMASSGPRSARTQRIITGFILSHSGSPSVYARCESSPERVFFSRRNVDGRPVLQGFSTLLTLSHTLTGSIQPFCESGAIELLIPAKACSERTNHVDA